MAIKNFPKHLIFLLINLLIPNFFGCAAVLSKEITQLPQLIQIKSIEINVINIFNHQDQNWLQRFANGYHIKTKEHVIKDLLPFKQGDWVTQEQILEAERILRSQSYLRDANLKLSTEGELQVKVNETWSLLPNFSFSRAGSQNSTAFGLRDSNFLGLGMATTLKYQKDEQKSGYRFRLTTPINFLTHSYASMILEDYDAGSQKHLEFSRPFIAQNTDFSFFTSVDSSKLEYSYFQNGDDFGKALTDIEHYQSQYGWLQKNEANKFQRNHLGLSHYSQDLINLTKPELSDLFRVREKSYFWWGKESVEYQYQVLKNIYLISNKEDINLGLDQFYRFGLGTIKTSEAATQSTGEQYLVDLGTDHSNMLWLSYFFSKGDIFDNLLLLQKFEFTSELYDRLAQKNYVNFNYQLDGFYPFDTHFSFYLGTSFSYTSEFRATPQALGGDEGLRGFPLQYQYGKKRWLTKFEARYHSDTDIFKMFSYGLAGFIDIGRAWDNPISENIEKGHLGSIGIGLRLFPRIASGKNVIHIDLAHPLSTNKQVNDWEWRVQVKESF